MVEGLGITVGMACKLFLSCFFLLASLHKLRDLRNFSVILGDYGLSDRLPRRVIAAAVAAAELVLAVLVLTSFSWLALYGMATLLAVYTAALLYVYASGKQLRDCGCGTNYRTEQATILWPALRNSLLIVGVGALAVLAPSASVAVTWYDWLVIVPLALILLIAYWTIEEIQSNRLLLAVVRGFNG